MVRIPFYPLFWASFSLLLALPFVRRTFNGVLFKRYVRGKHKDECPAQSAVSGCLAIWTVTRGS